MHGSREKAEARTELLLLLAAVCGLALLLHSVEGVYFQLWPVLLAAPGAGILLWRFRQRGKRKAMWLAFSALLAGSALSLLVPAVQRQLQALSAALWSGEASGQEVTGAALALTVAAALAVFLLELILRTHWPLYALTTLGMLTAPFLGIDPGVPAVFLFFAFQTGFWAMHSQAARGKRAKRSGSKAPAAAVLSGVFLLAVFVVGGSGEWLFQAAYRAEGFLQRTAKQASGAVADPGEGTVSRGNLYPAGTEQLELRTAAPPTETLYLKGFTGGDYQNGEWAPADDEAVFARMEQNSLHWGEWSDWIPGMYETLYFVMNSNMLREEGSRPRELWIRQRADTRDQWYTPYFSMWNRRFTRQEETAESGYGYRYYETGEVAIDWRNVVGSFDGIRDWYYGTQQAYAREAEDVYTAVPREELPRLAALCAENPVENVEQATALILTALQGSAEYTRTPGLFPMNQDPVEYFLFEGQEGYCQHFASAAVLMYRLYGVPARYAAGYAVSPSQFVRQEDGSYLAVVTDESAHAWPEIFLENYGWVPIEVTPSGAAPSTVYPGMDSGLLEDVLSAQSWNLSLLRQQQGSQAEQTAASAGSAPLFPAFALPEPAVLLVVALYLLFFAAASFLIYRASRLRQIAVMDPRRLFARMERALQACGLLRGYSGSEEELIRSMPGLVPGFTEGQARRLLGILQAEAFGPSSPGAAAEEEVRDMYRQVVGALYRGLPAWKKPAFKYGGNYL